MKNFEALPHLVSSVPDSPIKIDVDAVQDINGCRRYYVKIPLQIFVCLASDCFGFSYTNISVHYTISQATFPVDCTGHRMFLDCCSFQTRRVKHLLRRGTIISSILEFFDMPTSDISRHSIMETAESSYHPSC